MNKKSTKDILQAPRGMRDFFGVEFQKQKNFFKEAEKVAERYGFSGIETPIMEHTEIFHKGVGEGTDIVDKEMYNLETTGGDKLTLRPEGTAAIMRAYIEHGMGSLPGPQMLYYSGPFFRHEKPQKGRYRQLYQFGLEIMGSKNPLYDVLIIQTGYEILKKTRQEIIVAINSIGSNTERTGYIKILREFYKKNESNIAESDKSRIESNPLRILDSKENNTKEVNKTAPKIYDSLTKESKEYFNSILSKLDTLNIPYEIVPELVRGLDYYEHTVFEYIVRDKNGNNSHALGGGGRYDGLAEMIGHNKAIPSVGLGLGVDRIIEISDDSFVEKKEIIPLLIADESAYVKATEIVKILQEKNINVSLYPLVQKLSKQISRMEKENYKNILILGENEIEKNTVILKKLDTREQQEIDLDNLETALQNL